MPINAIIHQITTHQPLSNHHVSSTLSHRAIVIPIATIWFEVEGKDNCEGHGNHQTS